MNKLLTISLLVAASLQTMAQAPTVTTDARYARGATKAFVRATFKANGSMISERGVCYSAENSQPTVGDNVAKKTFSNGGLIFRVENLQPATKYYVRPYAKAQDGTVGYGEALKIVTLPKGNIGWGYDNGGSQAENDRINAAVKECVDYWNDLTSISGLYLNVHYGAQTPTADCSYGGWMRVGPNASYQKTGTIMHEALHAIGVGTHSLWYGPSVMRAESTRGQWLGDRATELVRFWDNNSTAILNGDATHLWPYGINGAQEDNGTEMLYTITSLMAQAVCEDGIPATTGSGCGEPHYAFAQEDNVKYYIKSESETYGLYTSYLVEDAGHNLRWQAMSAAEAVKNDAAAWYVTFTADNQYYQLRNAKTGYYMTYSGAGLDGIKTVQRATPTAAEDFQLRRSRIDITTAAGSLITPQRGYWVIRADKSTSTPGCLTGYKDGGVTVQNYNLANGSRAQRWLILTADQAADMDDNSTLAVKDEFMSVKTFVEGLIATPHRELVEGANAALAILVDDLTAKCNASKDAAEIQGYADELFAAAKAFLEKVAVKDPAYPFDLTSLLTNPDFASDKNGWGMASGAAWGSGAVEFYVDKITTVNATQIVKDMPKGTYTMKVQGFQRPGSNDVVYSAFTSGTNAVTVSMWINSTSLGRTFLKNVMEERSATSLHSSDKKLSDGTYVPNTMASTAEHFAKGYYDNEVTAYVGTAGNLTLILRGSNAAASSWTIFDNFRLYYLGNATMDEITGVEAVVERPQGDAPKGVFNLNGQYVGDDVNALPAGVYVVNGKAVVKK